MVISNFKLVPWWFYPIVISLKIFALTISTFKWKLFAEGSNFKELLILNIKAQFYTFALPSSLTGDISKVVSINKNK